MIRLMERIPQDYGRYLLKATTVLVVDLYLVRIPAVGSSYLLGMDMESVEVSATVQRAQALDGIHVESTVYSTLALESMGVPVWDLGLLMLVYQAMRE